MARSVYIPNGAEGIIYFALDIENEDEGWYVYDEIIDTIKNVFQDLDDSLYENGPGSLQEGVVLLGNGYVDIAISEYCGIYALSFIPKETPKEDIWEPLQNEKIWPIMCSRWINDIREKSVERLERFSSVVLLNCVRRFSNGEAVFERVTA
jgi:hypothetical protein